MAGRSVDITLFARDNASKTFDRVGKSAATAGGRFDKLGSKLKAGAAVGAVALAALGKSSISAASNMEESLSKARTVFGDASASVEAFAKTAAKNLGISRQEALESTATFGNLFTAMHIGKKPAADMSTKLVKLAADMASFNNADPKEVLENLRAGLLGEAEPLRKFGVQLSAARIAAEAMATGIAKPVKNMEKIEAAAINVQKTQLAAANAVKKYGVNSLEARDATAKYERAEAKLAEEMKGRVPDLTAQAKAQAALSIIMKDTAAQQGDVERTGGSLANQQRKLAASVADLKANLGKGLLPVAVKVTGTMMSAAGWFDRNRKTIIPLVAVIGGLVAIVWAVNVAARAYAATQAALNIVMAANPIGLVVLALAALGVGLVLAWRKSETFRAIVMGAFNGVKTAAVAVFNWIKSNWPYLVGALAGPFGIAAAAIYRNWGAVKDFFAGIWRGIVGGAEWAVNKMIDAVNLVIGVWNRIPGWLKPGGDIALIRHIGEPALTSSGRGANAATRGGGGGVQEFATGGMVEGPPGSPQLAVVHGGEQVLTPRQQRGTTINVTVNSLDPRTAAAAVRDELLKMQRSGVRLGFAS